MRERRPLAMRLNQCMPSRLETKEPDYQQIYQAWGKDPIRQYVSAEVDVGYLEYQMPEPRGW